MSFETYNKGNNQKNDSVNTRGIQMKNRFGVDASTLVVQYWDDKLNLMLHPQLPNPTEKQVYDYEKKIMVTLKVDKAMSLLRGMKMIIEKAIKENKEASVGITLPQSDKINMVVMSTVMREGSLDVVLYLCRDLNPETKIPKEKFSYTFFKDEEVIEGYDVNTGSIEDILTVQTEFRVFKKALKEYIRIMQQADVHSDRYNDRFYRNSLIDKVTKIGDKVGALDSGHYTGSYNKSPFSSGFSKPDSQPAQTSTLDDLKDIF